jgi:hypothetical protein
MPMARKAKTNPKGSKKNTNLGRPTKYNKDIPKKMINWFREMTQKEGEMKGKVYLPPKLPTFERFAVFEIDVCMDTLMEWRQHYEDFSAAYNKCKMIQKDHLNQHGLNGSYNAHYTKFVAMNVTDMREKVETTNDNKNEIKLSYSIE